MSERSFCLYVVGRVRGLTRGRLALAVESAGGRLARGPSERPDLIALGHGSASAVLAGAPALSLPRGISPDATLISERALRRRLGLLAADTEHKHLSAEDIARASGLEAEAIRCLVLYDVLEPSDERFAFRDLRAAREVRRLLDRGFRLAEIVEASLQLRRSGRGLHDTTVAEAPWGGLLQEVGGRRGRLDGQFVLPLDENCASLDEILSEAESREAAGDLEDAERLYRIALPMDPRDPVIPFNLGNVLDALGRPREAMLLHRQAIGRDPAFAEAWVNLAALQETDGRPLDAEASLRRALECDAGSPLALHNLGLLLTRANRLREALPLWDRYLALRPLPADAAAAVRLRNLCWLSLQSA
jgi:tetratricopeptide (TPR) repeat protein